VEGIRVVHVTGEYRVLVPLDGSKLAEWALAYLAALRKIGDLGVTLVSVVEQRGESDHGAGEREQNLLAAYLREVGGDLVRHLGVEAETVLRTGISAEEILRLEDELRPDLNVIATHGRTGLSRWRLGSVSDKVIRGAKSNTLLIGPRAAERAVWLEADRAPAFKKILVPLDGSPASEQALPIADRFAEAFDAELHLLRVLGPGTHTEHPLGPGNAQPTYFFTVPQAREYLQGVTHRLTRPGDARIEVLLGRPEDQISEYAATNSIDLIVLTTHGRSGFARVAFGSVTERLLGGPMPLLVVKSMAIH
jgi:nucleotide-binding universal stress UspA family protein